jgi:tRNA (cytidine/uridine-2'-O-)-methyltransferase
VRAPICHVVLHEPEIPNNTGAIGRTCVATGCALHLIRPIAFDTSEKACRRAGLDYWPRLAPSEHEDWDDLLRTTGADPDRLHLFTTKATRPVWDVEIRRGDFLIFGKETRGLPDDLLDRYPDRLVTLPLLPGERSLNVANAACAAVYEALRQMCARGELAISENARIDLR